ncbi:NUDIX domain-containing protein, partial [Bacillus sp. HC-Mk]
SFVIYARPFILSVSPRPGINGRAYITNDEEILKEMQANGRNPLLGIVVEIEECYIHCAKAFIRSKMWESESWLNKKELPSAGHIMHDEDVQIGGLREIEEELGLSFQTTDLVYKGIFKIDYEISNLTDREFCHMYFHNVINPLPFAPGEEVDDVMKVHATSFLQLLFFSSSFPCA